MNPAKTPPRRHALLAMSGLTLLAAVPLPAAGPSAPLFENSDFRSGTLGSLPSKAPPSRASRPTSR